jgi:hypothetical protein
MMVHTCKAEVLIRQMSEFFYGLVDFDFSVFNFFKQFF